MFAFLLLFDVFFTTSRNFTRVCTMPNISECENFYHNFLPHFFVVVVLTFSVSAYGKPKSDVLVPKGKFSIGLNSLEVKTLLTICKRTYKGVYFGFCKEFARLSLAKSHVHLTYSFWINRTEVTRKQFYSFLCKEFIIGC